MVIPQYEPFFGKEERDAVTAYMDSGAWLTEHKETERFEKMFSAVIGCDYASAVNNGTISLSIALLALGLKPGDRVVVPNLTMIATASAVQLIGCIPVLCDVDPTNLCLDLELAKQKQIDTGAKAVIYVPLNGRSHNSFELIKFRGALHVMGASLVEDSAQALGAKTPDGVSFGLIGDIASFSLSPHKIVSTGQGGMLTTNDPYYYDQIEKLKDFGRRSGGADVHDTFGINSKFTDLQAVIGIEQLKKLSGRCSRKNMILRDYESLLDGMDVQFIPHCNVPWFIDIYVDKDIRLQLVELLKEKGIGTRLLYPPLHTQLAMAGYWGSARELEVSTEYSVRGIWLPSSFNLLRADIEFISREVGDCLELCTSPLAA
jgi:perosamine synthetase